MKKISNQNKVLFIFLLTPLLLYAHRGIFSDGFFLLSDLEVYLNQNYSFKNALSTWSEGASELNISQSLFFYEIFFYILQKIFLLSDNFIQKFKYIFIYYIFAIGLLYYYKYTYLKNKNLSVIDVKILITIFLLFVVYPTQKHGNVHLILGYSSLLFEITIIKSILDNHKKDLLKKFIFLTISISLFKTHPNTIIYSYIIFLSYLFFNYNKKQNFYPIIICLFSLIISQIHNFQSFLYLLSIFKSSHYINEIVSMWDEVNESILSKVYLKNIFIFQEYHQSSSWINIPIISNIVNLFIPVVMLLSLRSKKELDTVKFSFYMVLASMFLMIILIIDIDIIQNLKSRTILFHNPNYLAIPTFILFLILVIDIVRKIFKDEFKNFIFILFILIIFLSNKLFLFGDHNLLTSNAIKLPKNYDLLLDYFENKTDEKDLLLIFPNHNFRKHKWHKSHFSDLIHASTNIRVYGAGTLKIRRQEELNNLSNSIKIRDLDKFSTIIEKLNITHILVYNDLENFYSEEINKNLNYFIRNKTILSTLSNENYSLFEIINKKEKEQFSLEYINNAYKFKDGHYDEIIDKEIIINEKFDNNWKIYIKKNEEINRLERIKIFINNSLDLPNKKNYNFFELNNKFFKENDIESINSHEAIWKLNKDIEKRGRLFVYVFNSNQDRFHLLLIIQFILLALVSLSISIRKNDKIKV